MENKVKRILELYGYNPEIVDHGNYKEIKFRSEGFDNFKPTHKQIIEIMLGDNLMEFYYGDNLQSIYYKDEK